MALIEVYGEPWVYCSCGEQEPLARKGKILTGHQFILPDAEEPAHETQIVYELQAMIVSGAMWGASALATEADPMGHSADLAQWQDSTGRVIARIPAP